MLRSHFTRGATALGIMVALLLVAVLASASFASASSKPVVTKVSPTGGAAAGGTSVTVTGKHFEGVKYVKFGGNKAAHLLIVSSTKLTMTAPAGTGTVNVRVTAHAGTSATRSAAKYTYGSPLAPTVTGLSPASGPAVGGTAVTITGTNFTGATAVHFGKHPAAFIVTDDTHIAVTSPAGAGLVDVTVTTPHGTSVKSAADWFTYIPAPTVTVMGPNAGSVLGGTVVVIRGSGFTGATAVTFGPTDATIFNVDSDTQITATAPPGSGTVDVTVTAPNGTSAPTAADLFTYRPAVTAINPSHGPATGGTLVFISGAGFTGAFDVRFGTTSAAAFFVSSDSLILAIAPPGRPSAIVHVTVLSLAGTSETSVADQYTYGPAVTALLPAFGPAAGGTVVTITGVDFTGATSVRFGNTSAQSFTVISDTQITAVSPPGTGVVHVTVTTPAGTSAPSITDRFTYAPTITAISPNQGAAIGGTTVTITGTGFSGATIVAFGLTPATYFVTDATHITAISPAGSGTVDITVTTAAGTSPLTPADRFIYGP